MVRVRELELAGVPAMPSPAYGNVQGTTSEDGPDHCDGLPGTSTANSCPGELYCPKCISAITKAVVAKWHGDIAKEHGPVQANRCKALLATMFSKASNAVGYTGPNPCIGVANFAERSRERFLLPAEMQAFFAALATEEPYWQAFFLLCLFTGSRRGNVASMEWAELDLENAVWHIPSTKTKNKRPTTIALCAPPWRSSRRRSEQRNGSPYVFPAFKGDGHLIDPRKSWDRILTAAKIDNLHMHDLRRTQGSVGRPQWESALRSSARVWAMRT